MCLTRPAKKKCKAKTFYKVFDIVDGEIVTPFQLTNMVYEIDELVESSHQQIPYNIGCDEYKSGFHAFISLQSAKNYKKHIGLDCECPVIYKVEMHPIVAYGYQRSGRMTEALCAVGRKMRIIEEVK
jgi:hypothetical protein